MNKIYQHSNNSHRSNAAQGSANANTNRVQNAAAAQTATGQATPSHSTNNVPNNNTNINNSNINHGHQPQQQQQHHNQRQHGHSTHQQHRQHHPHHHQQQQQQQHHHHHQQQQQQQQHHHINNHHPHHQQHHHPHHQQQHHQQQSQQPQQQQQQQPQQQPQQQQPQHSLHIHPQNHPVPAYAPANHLAHDSLDHHPQQPPMQPQQQQSPLQPPPLQPHPMQQPSQVQPGTVVPSLPQQAQQQAPPQNNPVIKHHPQQQASNPQQASMVNSQLHQQPLPTSHHQYPHQQPPQHHNSHNPNHSHHHNQQQHPHLHHHQTQIPISPAMPPQQWVGGLPQNHASQPPQPQPPTQPNSNHHPHPQQQPAQHHTPQQQQHHAPPPQHISPHPQTQMMLNQQYPGPNFLYTQIGNPYVQAGHLPQYDHSPAASHQQDTVNISSQPQPVSINNHHPNSLPSNQIPASAVITTAATGTANVHHQINNGSMMDHISNRLPLNQSYMLPNPYIQSPFNPMMLPYPISNLNAYAGGHLPQPTMIPPIRVAGDLGIRHQYDTQNPQATPLQPGGVSLNQPPGVKPPTSLPTQAGITPTVPQMAPKTREKKALPIVDPLTKHVFTEDELKGSPTISNQGQSSKDSGAIRISPKNPSTPETEVTNGEVTTTSGKSSRETSSSDSQIEEAAPQTQQTPSSTIEVNNATKHQPSQEDLAQDEVDRQPKTLVVENPKLENGDLETKTIEAGIKSMSISAVDELSDEFEEKNKDTPVKKQTLPNLPYAAGQYSPLNPNGNRKYTIDFLRAVAREMKLELDTSSAHNHRIDNFAPHYVNQQGMGNYRDFSSSPLLRRSSQQMINKPRKIITTHSLQQEVELKTAEKPWKPELEIEKTKIIEGSEMDTKRLLKVFRGYLNKITPDKYDSLIEKIAVLDLDGPERLNSVIDLVFDKAVDEPGFCELYARVCRVIATKDSEFCFHLVKKCQEEFETSDLYDGLNVDERKLIIEQEVDVVKKKHLSEELYEEMRNRRKKYLGTIKLIGEMYKLGLLLPKIIGLCMTHLIDGATNENIECLCSLISTVGSKMANEPDDCIKNSLKHTLHVLKDLAHSEKRDLFGLESRIKFKILDTIDLSKRNWRPRMVENNPKKIDEIHEEAKEELMRQQQQNHSSQNKNLIKPDDRDRARRVGNQVYNTFSKGANQQKW